MSVPASNHLLHSHNHVNGYFIDRIEEIPVTDHLIIARLYIPPLVSASIKHLTTAVLRAVPYSSKVYLRYSKQELWFMKGCSTYE